MRRKRHLTPLLLSLLASGCAVKPAPIPADELFRPQLSYSPQRNWMNDPNGLVYHDGEYHLFYQYNPNGSTWGDMSWGHAVSPDLLRWAELPPALPVRKDSRGNITEMIFSGSAVVDHANTSGLGQPGRPAMVALYTSVYPQTLALPNGRSIRAGTQAQSLVYSLDRGRSWQAHPDNPVLELPPAPYAGEYRDFRDPKLFWHAPQQKWVMVLVLPNKHKALFYSSRDLRHWEWMSEFGPAAATGGIWECPDLFELPVDGDPARRKWVLIMSPNPGGPAGGSGTQYFLGHFDGTRFVADPPAPGQPVRWLDHGADFYAAVSYNGMPDGRRVLVGWMNNWLYGQQVPTGSWRSAQSVPRELALRTIDGQVQLVQQPIAEFERQRSRVLHQAATTQVATGEQALGAPAREALELGLALRPQAAARTGLRLRSASGEQVDIGYDALKQQLYVERNGAGQHAFHPDFANRQSAPAVLRDGSLRLRVLVDRASVTVFAGEGETVLTSQFFADPATRQLLLFADGAPAGLRDLTVWSLRPVR
jgi:sucrose-6-phosphate hydrolase SacC (GH32 family)